MIAQFNVIFGYKKSIVSLEKSTLFPDLCFLQLKIKIKMFHHVLIIWKKQENLVILT